MPAISEEQIKSILNQAGQTPKERIITRREGGQLHKETQQLHIRTKPIVWGIPGDELMFFKFFSNFVRLGFMPWDTFATTESTYLPSARNDIHNAFLELDESWTHLMMLDSDVLPAPWTVQTLLGHNKDCVSGWYHKKGPQEVDGKLKAVPTVYGLGYEVRDGIPYYSRFNDAGEGLEKVGAIGAGCMMMSRKLAEDLGESPYHMNSGGEDMVICKKITDLGYDIWVDWSLACAHVGVSWV